ncbi:winged helix-turn-helix transcriptional regulator [Enterococcus sp. AZ163]|uniref:winged helix-turn-helix transcriptional regulator n=1 Tax=Enterococcus sp. AZ163 TaxID=2774638 RepID=UPI003D2D8C67
MKKNETWICGLGKAINLLGGKWRLNILWELSKNELIRFNELKRKLPGISNLMLTRSLEALQQEDLITKRNVGTYPLHVEYSLTEKSKSLVSIMKSLNQWGDTHL